MEFKWIPVGLPNSPAAFNRALQNLVVDIPGLFIFMDDIGGRNTENNNKNLQLFLKRADEVKLRLSKEKCIFNGKRLQFLGLIITNGTITAALYWIITKNGFKLLVRSALQAKEFPLTEKWINTINDQL